MAWKVRNADNSGEQTLVVGPSKMTERRSKTLLTQSRIRTGANTVSTVLIEGPANPITVDLEGTVHTEAGFLQLESWFSSTSEIRIVDDLNRNWLLLIEKFTPRREYKPFVPWFHRWSASAVVLGVS